MSIFKWLQFFADGGATGGDAGGGDGAAAAGVQAADAGRSLEDLGVPKEKAEQFRARRAKRQPPAVVAETQQPARETPETAETATATASADEWETFFQNPDHQQRLQSMMADRGKAATKAREQADAQTQKLEPLLDLLGKRYDIQAKDGQYDLDAIVAAATGDDTFFEDRALEKGESVSEAKDNWRKEYDEELRQRHEREEQLRQHFFGMQQQAEKLKETFPDFDLNRELENPEFFKLTSPEVGASVENAFYALHHGDIMQQHAEAIARRAKADAAASIRSGIRPRENGASSATAPMAAPDLRKMTPEQRLAYIKSKYPAHT